ncbi:Iron-chelate-transporting ATPase [Bertholletia excelsa]
MAAPDGMVFYEIDTEGATEAFGRPSNAETVRQDEEDLMWSAVARLPSAKRYNIAVLKRTASEARGRVATTETVDVRKLSRSVREHVVKKALATTDQDNYKLLSAIKDRLDKVGIEVPKVEVRFENLHITADVQVGSRALPTLLNSVRDSIEGVLSGLHIFSANRHRMDILNNISGTIKPGRMTLLLGPPGAGKSTLLLALAGKLDPGLKKSGRITYNGHDLNDFCVKRTSAYTTQTDNHIAELTVRETLDFAARCQGVEEGMQALMKDLYRLERERTIHPVAEIDAFMKASVVGGTKHSVSTDYTLKVLGLDVCAETIVGNDMLRGVSGGQRKRVTTGEMIVGPRKTIFMDEISTGLDSSTTYQIVKCIGNFVHLMEGTVLMALLQPAPETFDLFDDLILLSEGHLVYHGPREEVLEFFESLGFQCPPRKGVADFLQEVTSRKDQAQYWAHSSKPYVFIPVPHIAEAFRNSKYGRSVESSLSVEYDKSKSHHSALAKTKYAISKWELFKACFSRELLLMRRHSFLYIFRTCQVTFVGFATCTAFLRARFHPMDEMKGNLYLSCLFFGLVHLLFNGFSELPLMIFRLPVFYKQRDNRFYPAWVWSVSSWILGVPYSVLEAFVWSCVTYYTIGFSPAPGRFFAYMLVLFLIHQMALGLFRMMASLARDLVIASTYGSAALLIILLLGGFIIPKDMIKPWWIWGFWISPLSYGQRALSVNEFTASRWMKKSPFGNTTLGRYILQAHALPTDHYWYWIGIGVLFSYAFLFNIIVIIALTYLNPIKKSQAMIPPIVMEDNLAPEGGNNRTSRSIPATAKRDSEQKGMILPFEPLTMTFHNVNYYVDMPKEMTARGVTERKLQLLSDVSGVFSPGVLTALVGSSGAGKTTLMDVLAGRKTGGYIEGDIRISGYPKEQRTFARISGYVEQNDIHSPQLTVFESLVFSSSLRLPKEVAKEKKNEFVEEVMRLVELDGLRGALVGLPGSTGLSTEQRKRLTIAVELVANPSIIFMDEPTSGLDARAAAIVMRTVRNTVDTGRTVVCTIHQPSIDIFEAFDELLLMKRGGRVIYGGKLGEKSQTMIDYFQSIPGVSPIPDGYNPATWMLEVSTAAAEERIGQDFADIYRNSRQFKEVEDSIERFSVPPPNSAPLKFDSTYAQDMFSQFKYCIWKQHWVYWRSPSYNTVRLVFTTVGGLIIGSVYWGAGSKRSTQQDLFVLLSCMYSACLFLGVNNASSVQPIVAIERTVFYREKAAGMYSPFSYAAAQGLVEVPYIAVQSILYSIITYFMMDLAHSAGKFFLYILFMFLTFSYFTFYGMMAVGLTATQPLAAVISSGAYSLWNLLSGFIIQQPSIPGWWIWLYYICPIAWTLKGIISSQLGDDETIIVTPGFEGPVKEYLKHSMGFESNMVGISVAVLVGFSAVFFCVFALSVKVLNFQKR